MKYEESFGVVPLRFEEGQWLVFLVALKEGHHWGFPKGHGEEGETPLVSAKRELKEETNLDIVSLLYSEPLVETYQFSSKGEKIHKEVSYFIAKVEGVVHLQAAEIENGLWLSFPQAMEKLTYSEGKSILSKTINIVMGLEDVFLS